MNESQFSLIRARRGGIRWDRVGDRTEEGPLLHDCETPEPREYWERFEDPEDEPWTCEVCKAVWDIDWMTCPECRQCGEEGPTWYRRLPAGRFRDYTVLSDVSQRDTIVAPGGWCAPSGLGLDIP